MRTRAAFIGFTPLRYFLSGTRNTKKKHPKKEKDKQSQLRSILPDYRSAGGELARQRWEQRALGLAHDDHELCIATAACSARRTSLTTNLSCPLAVLHFQIHRKL